MLKTNEYFDGNIKSIAFLATTEIKKQPATVGVMAIGDYIFNTSDQEEMTIISGAMTIKFSEADESQIFTAGESFNVEADSSFNVTIKEETAYLCLYG